MTLEAAQSPAPSGGDYTLQPLVQVIVTRGRVSSLLGEKIAVTVNSRWDFLIF